MTEWTACELFFGVATTRKVTVSGTIFGENFDPQPVELAMDATADAAR